MKNFHPLKWLLVIALLVILYELVQLINSGYAKANGLASTVAAAATNALNDVVGTVNSLASAPAAFFSSLPSLLANWLGNLLIVATSPFALIGWLVSGIASALSYLFSSSAVSPTAITSTSQPAVQVQSPSVAGSENLSGSLLSNPSPTVQSDFQNFMQQESQNVLTVGGGSTPLLPGDQGNNQGFSAAITSGGTLPGWD